MSFSKRFGLGLSVMLLGLLALTWGLQAQSACPGANPSRLLVGSMGRVIPIGGPNNVRNTPSTSGKRLGQIDPGKTFKVLEGPTCNEDVTWLRVVDDNGLAGWTAELIGMDYALEPALPELVPTAVVPPGAVDYNGIHVDVDPALAAQVESKIDLGQPSGVEVFPAGYVLTLQDGSGYTLGTIHIVSAQSFNNRYLTTALSLGDVLAGTPDVFIPHQMSYFVNNGILLASAQQKVVTFAGGQGVRRLVLYGQTPMTPDDHLVYELHGLTTDGLYYVQAAFNVAYNDAALFTPPTQDASDPNLSALMDTYRTTVETALNAAATEAFSPNPAQLDAVIASLTIAPDTLSDVIGEADTIATAFAPTQSAILTQQYLPTQAPTATLSDQELGLTATASVRCGPFDAKLHVGDLARQVLKDGTLRVRQLPNGEPIPDTRLFFEDVVRVEEGPVCVEETNWWRISALDGSFTGWVAEAGLDSAYLIWLSPTPLPPTDIPAGPTAEPTRSYDCTYTPATSEHALIEPAANGRWEFFLIAGQIYHAIYQTQSDGQTWYMLAHESQINVREDGTGAIHNRISWVMGATGSECGSLPSFKPPRMDGEG